MLLKISLTGNLKSESSEINVVFIDKKLKNEIFWSETGEGIICEILANGKDLYRRGIKKAFGKAV